MKIALLGVTGMLDALTGGAAFRRAQDGADPIRDL